jgi:hypothetical protein
MDEDTYLRCIGKCTCKFNRDGKYVKMMQENTGYKPRRLAKGIY